MIPRSFYMQSDVVSVARELLGKRLCTRIDGIQTSGIISETEAYAGISDRASHAYGGRRTNRTEIMYARGGTAYVYLCYGVHSLFNVVTNKEGVPHAVLIRGIDPADGIEKMKKRRGKAQAEKDFSNGPGKVAMALGIHFTHSGLDLTRIPSSHDKPAIWIEEAGSLIPPEEIITTTRIGVEYAGKDAKLPYRFLLNRVGRGIAPPPSHTTGHTFVHGGFFKLFNRS
ncbi:MAG: DNA-3-methyladenine glycosylase [Deltaproteobacteria bacterium]|nr:DNA-3-methyladenine glycosylase [Deltaproteobacteria bacterium]